MAVSYDLTAMYTKQETMVLTLIFMMSGITAVVSCITAVVSLLNDWAERRLTIELGD